MSSKLIAAALTTALAIGVLTADVSGATTRPQSDGPRAASSGQAPGPDASADGASSTARMSIGPLGRVLTSVDALVDAANPPSGSARTNALQERFAAVDAAARELRDAYREQALGSFASLSPSVPLARTSVRPSPPSAIAADDPTILPAKEDEPRILPAEAGQEPRTLPAQESSTRPAPLDLHSALGVLVEDAQALVETASDPNADEAAVRKAAQPITQDAVAVVTSTVQGIKRS
ncbi:hypothetical protein [Streptomyces meridianus]|uniref:Secreted protein n=1 Tax=Streptomyces meridianus TaxID=2938945 RepID=A0ABT0X991_9ACTN|nr:hypothetical protein [Streptomyces meridianus]MCM2578984.1 hypothetical protein [Streptomyces meridianus]